MASKRRMGVQNSETRAQLIEAAERIIREEGYGALTARRLAELVGLKRQIVHYYFGTTEDLLLAVIRDSYAKTKARLLAALETTDPLKVIWQFGNRATSLSLEFVAVAARHEGTRTEIRGQIDEIRLIFTEALQRQMDRRGAKSSVSPAAICILLMSISEAMRLETTLGATEGHAETRALVDGWLRSFDATGDLFGSGSD